MSSEEDPLVLACSERVGQTLSGKWRLDALIGVGGMAAVYAASHRNGARAAIKLLHPELAGHTEIKTRFLREAYIANKVDHSGTVKVLDDDVSEAGEPYIVMELLTGESVESRASRNGGWLRYPEVLSIIEQTLAVLEKAHAAGVVHRDLKPDNLFLSARGEVKVLDFGIAHLREADGAKRTQTGMMMGTPAYMPPEQALGRWEQVDGRTDLWAVGAIFFTLLSGRHVHEAQSDNEMLIRAATRPAPSLARVVPNAPPEVVQLVDKVLEFEQSARFPDARAMRIGVRALMQAAGVAPFGAVGAAPVQMAPAAPARVAAPPPSAHVPTALGQAPPARNVPAPEGMAPAPVPKGPAAHMMALGATLAQGGPEAPAPVATAAQSAPAFTAFGPAEPAARSAQSQAERAGGSDGYDAAYASDADIAGMKDIFAAIEKSLIAQSQYGPRHPEARRRADHCFKLCASALMQTEYALVWNITPYSFEAGEHPLWEPEAPYDRIPYQLFADGVRLFALTPGLDETEFRTFLGMLTLDRTTEVAPEDDFATLLWDADFQHVVHQIVDTFADGDQVQRVQFESSRDAIVQLAHFDTADQLSECWQERQAAPKADTLAARQRAIVMRVTAGSGDAEARARAANLRVAEGATSPIDPGALRVDDAVKTMLSARLTMESGGLSERFAVTVARAFEDGLARDGAANITTPLRLAVDGLARTDPDLAIDMVGALCREVGSGMPEAAGQDARARFAGAIVSPKMVESVLEGVKAEGANHAIYAKGLRTILGYCDETYFAVVLPHLGRMPDAELRDVLATYLTRTGAGHEAEMGHLFAEADIEFGLSLLRVLSQLSTQAAKEAISLAVHSPHPVVRIEALGHVEGVSSERLRLELRTLLEDREGGVRTAALRAMEQYSIRVAGPFLVLRVRAPDFSALPFEERRQAFSTLASLAPTRAEAVALEVVNERRLVASGEHEATRELAVELLGRIGGSKEVLEVLTDLSTARFRNSDRVRTAAALALEKIASRRSAPPAGAGKAPSTGAKGVRP